jgi:glyoxylase-like metal-dependent hydrolase (beta-lactamase superfamily II)
VSDLQHIAGSISYLPGVVQIGVLVADGKAIAIDTGLDETAARKLLKVLEGASLRLIAIVNTHSHADHCGGNAFLKKRTGVPIYAPPIEAAFIQHPVLEPSYFFGAVPFREVAGKWLMAAPSPVDHILGERATIEGIAFECVPLPGHSIGQIGIATPDVLWCADALMSEEILEKYRLMYVYDPEAHRQTLERLKGMRKAWTVGAHFPPLTDPLSVIEANLKNLDEAEAAVIDAVDGPVTTEEVVARVCQRFGLTLTPELYLLNASAVKGHLSTLQRRRRVQFTIEGCRPLWRRTTRMTNDR